jgi:Ni,Fe-hydrogenase III large subunit
MSDGRGATDLLRAAPSEPCRPFPRAALSASGWADFAAALGAEPGLALLALWADTARVHALFHDRTTGDILPVAAPIVEGGFAALSPWRPAAAWFERMIRDLWGHEAYGGTDGRPWLDHGRWPSLAPMAARPTPRATPQDAPVFLETEGEDLHQIAVGPVHAGIIEPGHFRFTAQGETIARLELRLGWLHKGTLGLIRGKTPRAAARFAARLSGDSTVAHSIAFAHAAEAATATDAPPRAAALRAVMGELERVANHLGDCGGIATDAAYAWLPARYAWHREAMLRAASAAFGHRLMMDCVIPGGVAADIAPGGGEAILRALAGLEAELPALLRVYDDASSLVDRMVGTGILVPALAEAFAAGGFVGRASGRAVDLRRSPGYAPYDRLAMTVQVREEGDVDARVRVRLAEISDSVAMLRTLLTSLPDGAVAVPLPMASADGIGWAEGFRGDIWHWIRLDGGLIAAGFLRDPSWLQWPLMEAAIHGNIMADFPLCNKSFNCSYSGVDL